MKIDFGDIALIGCGLGAFFIMRKYADQKFSAGTTTQTAQASMSQQQTVSLSPEVKAQIIAEKKVQPVIAPIIKMQPNVSTTVATADTPVTPVAKKLPIQITTKNQLLYGIDLRL